MDALPPGMALYDKYHALIVRAGNSFCKKTRPVCGRRPLGSVFGHAAHCDFAFTGPFSG